MQRGEYPLEGIEKIFCFFLILFFLLSIHSYHPFSKLSSSSLSLFHHYLPLNHSPPLRLPFNFSPIHYFPLDVFFALFSPFTPFPFSLTLTPSSPLSHPSPSPPPLSPHSLITPLTLPYTPLTLPYTPPSPSLTPPTPHTCHTLPPPNRESNELRNAPYISLSLPAPDRLCVSPSLS